MLVFPQYFQHDAPRADYNASLYSSEMCLRAASLISIIIIIIINVFVAIATPRSSSISSSMLRPGVSIGFLIEHSPLSDRT